MVTVDMPQMGRTALHYAAAVPDRGYMYKLLLKAAPREDIEDLVGRQKPLYIAYLTFPTCQCPQWMLNYYYYTIIFFIYHTQMLRKHCTTNKNIICIV